MTTMKIFEAIPAIITDIEAVEKKRNPDSNVSYAYRRIDDFMNALHSLLGKHKVFIAPEVLSHSSRDITTKSGGVMSHVTMTIRYTIYAQDGSNVSAIMVGEAFDSGDKASNKAQSVALKYLIAQVFMVHTEDMLDPDDTASPEVKPNRPVEAPKPPTPPKSQPPMNPADKAQVPPKSPVMNSQSLSEKQIYRLMQKAKAVGLAESHIRQTVEARFHTSPEGMNKVDYESLCKELDQAFSPTPASGGSSR